MELDFTSDLFDPLKALYAKNIVLPYPQVKALDNLSRFAKLLFPQDPTTNNSSRPAEAAAGAHVTRRQSEDGALSRRCPFDARSSESKNSVSVVRPNDGTPISDDGERKIQHGADAEARERVLNDGGGGDGNGAGSTLPARRPRGHIKSILERMEDADGPLGFLHYALMEKRRVCVHMKHGGSRRGVRGRLTGFLIAFDKHMNMVLMDVEEKYTEYLRVPKTKHMKLPAASSTPHPSVDIASMCDASCGDAGVIPAFTDGAVNACSRAEREATSGVVSVTSAGVRSSILDGAIITDLVPAHAVHVATDVSVASTRDLASTATAVDGSGASTNTNARYDGNSVHLTNDKGVVTNNTEIGLIGSKRKRSGKTRGPKMRQIAVERSRRVGQLLVRGECVALVSLDGS